MAVLAQRFIDRDPRSPYSPMDDVVKRALLPTTALEQQATKIVFDEDLYAVLTEMVKAEQLDFAMICKHTRMPAQRLWLEWRDMRTDTGKVVDFGVLLLPSSDSVFPLRCIVVNHARLNEGSTPQISCAFDTVPPPYEAGILARSQLLWTLNDDKPERYREEMFRQLYALVIRTTVFALFLMQQPKVIDTVEVQHAAKLNKKRRERGKNELIAYRKTTMKFGVLGSRMGQVVRQGRSVGGGCGPGNISDSMPSGKRYHYVIGHFRYYHRDTPQEHIIWIEPHYRGDASKGILIRERILTTAKEQANA